MAISPKKSDSCKIVNITSLPSSLTLETFTLPFAITKRAEPVSCSIRISDSVGKDNNFPNCAILESVPEFRPVKIGTYFKNSSFCSNIIYFLKIVV